jgi:hypothetical protein
VIGSRPEARRHFRCVFSSRLRRPGGLGPRCRVLLALVFALLPLSLFRQLSRRARTGFIWRARAAGSLIGFLLPGSSPVFRFWESR